MKALWARFAHLVGELGRFGVVGAVTYLIDLSIYTGLYHELGWFTAKVASTAVAATCAFIGNRFWTWRDRERSGLRREYLLYFFFNAVGLGIALSCLAISHLGLGAIWPATFHTQFADTVASQGFGLVLGTLFRFWAYRRFVFLEPSADAGAADLADAPVRP